MIPLPLEGLNIMDTSVTILNQVLSEKRIEIAPELNDSEFFELFTAQQILRDYQLDVEEVLSGVIDGSGDGGIDAVYLIVDGRLIRDRNMAEELKSLKQNIVIDLIIIQSTMEESFSLKRVVRLKDTMTDFLSIHRPYNEFSETYNDALMDAIERFREAHTATAAKYPTLNISIYYACKGDGAKIREIKNDIKRKAESIEQTAKSILPTIKKCNFTFLGARDLYVLASKPPKTDFKLVCANSMFAAKGGYLALVNLADFYEFISEDGELREYLFEYNVRDYQRDANVNKAIRETLNNSGEEDFWWLNNGITILVSNATGDGKDLNISEPQIVNGLQTSQEIYESFKSNFDKLENDKRQTLVRIIRPTEPESQDKIIRATNSQTSIPPASLWATDPIHRDIEKLFSQKGLYYDRRKNHWRNQNVPLAQIVGITELAQSIIAIALQEPHFARASPNRYFKKRESYKKVFNSKRYPIDFYSFCAALRKKTESFLRKVEPDRTHRNNLIFYVLMAVVCLKVKSKNPQPKTLVKIDVSIFDDSLLMQALDVVRKHYNDLGGNDKVAKGGDLILRIKAELSSRFGKKRPKTVKKETL
ncbi:MAG: AIPR family protein [Tatlockia sp.]|jgi:hypothetical protein|nr:AIPR family protein [Tatlockia sp.]